MSHLTTFTGKNIDTNYPRLEDIDIEDIAHALSQLPVHGGHTYAFYSLAQRAVTVAKLVPEECRKAALLMEAACVYTERKGDLGDPENPSLIMRWHLAILEKFVVLEGSSKLTILHKTYWKVISTERRDLLNNWQMSCVYEPYPFGQLDMHPLTPDQAKHAFLKYFTD
jgi:hypothetical protein